MIKHKYWLGFYIGYKELDTKHLYVHVDLIGHPELKQELSLLSEVTDVIDVNPIEILIKIALPEELSSAIPKFIEGKYSQLVPKKIMEELYPPTAVGTAVMNKNEQIRERMEQELGLTEGMLKDQELDSIPLLSEEIFDFNETNNS